MKAKKHLIILFICSAILSLILFGAVFFQSISMLEFQYAQILLFAAETLSIISIAFIICFVLVYKGIITLSKIKKIILAIVAFSIIGCILLTGYGWATCYNLYTPENIMKNNKSYIQQFLPYHDILDDYRKNTELLVSHMPGTDYVVLNCYGISESGIPLNYKVEYFKSASLFMNMKFRTEKKLSSVFSIYDVDVVAIGKDIEIDGVELTVYVEDNDYAVLLKSFGQTCYASLINAPDGVTVEDFAKRIIEQIELFDNATKEKVFLNDSII